MERFGRRACCQAIADARANYAEQQTLVSNLETAIGRAETRSKTVAQNQKDAAAATKEYYDWLVKIYEIYANNPPGSPGGPPTPEQVAAPMVGGPAPNLPRVPSGGGGGGGGNGASNSGGGLSGGFGDFSPLRRFYLRARFRQG